MRLPFAVDVRFVGGGTWAALGIAISDNRPEARASDKTCRVIGGRFNPNKFAMSWRRGSEPRGMAPTEEDGLSFWRVVFGTAWPGTTGVSSEESSDI